MKCSALVKLDGKSFTPRERTCDSAAQMMKLTRKTTMMTRDQFSGREMTLSVPGSVNYSTPPSTEQKRKRNIQEDLESILWPEWWPEEEFVSYSKGTKGKRSLSTGNDGLRKGCFHLISQTKKDLTTIIPGPKMEKAWKELIPDRDFQPQKNPMKKDMAMPGDQTIGLNCSYSTGDSWTLDAGSFCAKAHTVNDPTHVVSIRSRAVIE